MILSTRARRTDATTRDAHRASHERRARRHSNSIMSAMSTVRARERCVDGGERRDAMGRETIGAAGRRARGAATARRETAARTRGD